MQNFQCKYTKLEKIDQKFKRPKTKGGKIKGAQKKRGPKLMGIRYGIQFPIRLNGVAKQFREPESEHIVCSIKVREHSSHLPD